MKKEIYAEALLNQIEQVSKKFMASVPDVQNQVQNQLIEMAATLKIKGGKLQPSVANLKAINGIIKTLQKFIMTPEYKENVRALLKAYDKIGAIQNSYFKTLDSSFSQPELLAEIKKQTVNSTVDQLLGAGISANLINPIKDILTKNVTSGALFSDLKQQMTDYISTNSTGIGALERYVNQVVTDSLNQYSAQYTQAVTNDLGLNWFMYVGSNIETTRDFCEHLTAKKYVHKSEIPEIISGNIDGYQVELNPKTGLPKGMVNGTTQYNFPIYRGGYNCGHQLIPISELAVPNSIKYKFKT